VVLEQSYHGLGVFTEERMSEGGLVTDKERMDALKG
jgi:hypothetical protein